MASKFVSEYSVSNVSNGVAKQIPRSPPANFGRARGSPAARSAPPNAAKIGLGRFGTFDIRPMLTVADSKWQVKEKIASRRIERWTFNRSNAANYAVQTLVYTSGSSSLELVQRVCFPGRLAAEKKNRGEIGDQHVVRPIPCRGLERV